MLEVCIAYSQPYKSDSSALHRHLARLTADKMAECRWLKPQLVAQIEYADWTDVNHLRHSKFIALRDAKPADVAHRLFRS
jgi:ATP-dependent DNA ligase